MSATHHAPLPPPPPPAPPAEAVALPTLVLFTHKYGFLDEESGLAYEKLEGAVEINPMAIRKLIERQAPILTDPGQIALWQMNAVKRKAEQDAADLAELRAKRR
jgi:hypothetical protein